MSGAVIVTAMRLTHLQLLLLLKRCNVLMLTMQILKFPHTSQASKKATKVDIDLSMTAFSNARRYDSFSGPPK